MGWYVAPAGTVTVRLVVLAAVTVAMVAPKNTMLLVVVALKLVPVMVTDVPTGPLAGVNEVMVGGNTGLLRNMDTVLLPLLTTARSGLPSPSRSPIATLIAAAPVAKSASAAKEPDVMEPLLAVLRKTDTVEKLARARSGLPSPSRSPIATLLGLL